MGFKRILVVDDSSFSRKNLVGILGDLGYEVEWSESGQNALQRIETDRFDIVITKLLMPTMDGWELLENARKSPSFEPGLTNSYPLPKFIYTTAQGDSATERKALNHGFTGSLIKPIEIQKVKPILQKVLMSDDEDFAIRFTGSDASMLKILAEKFGLDPKDLVNLLVEEVSLCGLGDDVNTGEDLKTFLLKRLRDNLLLLPGHAA